MTIQYKQQGDVLIKKIDKLPEGLTKLDTKILQESEITHHHHHFTKDAPVVVYAGGLLKEQGINTITPNEQKYIEVLETTFLYHGKGFDEKPAQYGRGDHDSIKIEPGVYEVGIVKEWDYDQMEAVRVVD